MSTAVGLGLFDAALGSGGPVLVAAGLDMAAIRAGGACRRCSGIGAPGLA